MRGWETKRDWRGESSGLLKVCLASIEKGAFDSNLSVRGTTMHLREAIIQQFPWGKPQANRLYHANQLCKKTESSPTFLFSVIRSELSYYSRFVNCIKKIDVRAGGLLQPTLLLVNASKLTSWKGNCTPWKQTLPVDIMCMPPIPCCSQSLPVSCSVFLILSKSMTAYNAIRSTLSSRLGYPSNKLRRSNLDKGASSEELG